MAIEYPYSEQAEKATLGAMLVDEDSQRAGLSSLEPGDFFVPSNRLIFEGMQRISEKQLAIDITTVTDDLNTLGQLDSVGGVVGLTSLVEGVVSANIDYYIDVLKEKKNLRDLLDLINQLTDDIAKKKIADSDLYLDDFEKKVIKIARNRRSGEFLTSANVISEIKEKYYQGAASKNHVIGCPSGYADLDRILNGFQKGDMIILAARTSVGKTQLAINFALNAARLTKKPVGFFSIEMPAEQIVNRMISTCSRIPNEKLRDFKLNQEDLIKFDEGVNKIADLDIYFDESSTRLIDIQTKARKLKNEHPDLALIVIDYLQLIEKEGKSENRTLEVSAISRGIKLLAKELDVPIICLAQLSRRLEQRPDKHPLLSDLRESGSIEQDADVVLFIYRDDLYKGADEPRRPETVKTELYIAKHRNGALGMVNLTFVTTTGEFSSYSQFSQ